MTPEEFLCYYHEFIKNHGCISCGSYDIRLNSYCRNCSTWVADDINDTPSILYFKNNNIEFFLSHNGEGTKK